MYSVETVSTVLVSIAAALPGESVGSAAASPVHEWEIPAYKLDAFKAKIAQANSRLASAGLGARFEVAYERFEVARNVSVVPDHRVAGHGDPVYVYEPWVRAVLVGPLRLSHGHFTFVATLVAEEAGVTVHSVPGQELGGYVPRGDNSCGHCRVSRDRVRLYLVRDDRDGSIIQLGHSCIELYTGVSPKGLWALTFDEELGEFTRDDVEGGFSSRDYGVSVEAVLAYSFAHSEKGRAYVPAGAYCGPSTAGQVRTSLFANLNLLKEADRQYFHARAAEAATYLADGELIAAIKASVESTSADSDYGRNLRVILAGTTVSGRNVGVLASLVKVYAREQQLEAERKANPIVAGFLGEVGERVKNIAATAKTVFFDENAWGKTTFLVAITDDGHVVVWKASKALDLETGQRFTMAAATVKEHGNYQGTDQTILARPAKFEVCP